MQQKKNFDLRWGLVALCMVMLTACGGGGGASADSASSLQSMQGAIASGVIVIPDAEAAATTLSLDAGRSDTLVVNNPTGVLASARTGQIVALPANDAQGIPFGLTTKVEKNADGSVSLKPAALEEVFNNLTIDFDSARDGAKIAGLISPKGGSIALNQAKPSSLQSGLEYSACQLGLQAVVTLNCKDGELVGSIGIEQKINVKKKGSTETASAVLYGTIDIRKLAAKVKIEFDKDKYPSTGGFNQAMVKLTGEWGAQIGIKLDDAAAKVEVPAWSELIRSDGANIWDDNTKVKLGKYFELSGLNGDDKKGLIPLGGFYLTPATPFKPFGGDLSAHELGAIKAGAIVVWVYIDLSGNLTLSGDLSLLKFNGAYIEKGFDITPVNGALETRKFDVQTNPEIWAPYLDGSVEASQNVGLAVASDLLVAGIRPFTVKAGVYGAKATMKVLGKGGYKFFPEPSGWDGSLCTSQEFDLYTDLVIKGRVNVKLDAGWIEASGGSERTWGPFTQPWKSLHDSGCFNSFQLPLTVKSIGLDPFDSSKNVVQLNFIDAFNNAMLRDLTGTWRLYIEGPSSTSEIDVDTSYGGIYSLPLGEGTYRFTMKALHKDFTDLQGKEVVVKASDRVTFTVGRVSITATPTPSVVGQVVEFVVSEFKEAIKVVWSFGTDVADVVNNVILGISDKVKVTFTTTGTKTITATFTDILNNVLGKGSTSVTVQAAPLPTATITNATSDVTVPPGDIASNGSTDDTTPTLSGTINAVLTSGQKVNLYDGDTLFAAVAEVSGTNWTFTPAIPLIGGSHSFTAEVATFDGTAGARSAAYVVNVLSASLTSVAPGEIIRTLTGSFNIVGRDLPISGLSVTVPGDPKAECQSPNNMTATGFGVACTFYKLGAQTLEIRTASKLVGTVSVLVKTNVTGVTWTSPSTTNSGTIKFHEDVTFKVAGVNLLADPVMGFAVQLCGVSNVETGVGSNTQRTFACNFNNDAGAVVGQMPGVVKDAPGGQVLFDGWNVAVEVPVSQGYNAANDFSPTNNPNGAWTYGWAASLGQPFQFGNMQKHSSLGLDAWNAPNTYPYIQHNGMANQIVGNNAIFVPNALVLHPGNNGEVAIVRWTAPTAGTYAVNAKFGGAEAGLANVLVQKNGVTLFQDVKNTSDPQLLAPKTYIGQVSFAAGDTLDFIVGNGGNGYLSDTTRLEATVVTVPVQGSQISGVWYGWDGKKFSEVEIVQKDGYATKATSNWGHARMRFATPVDGDNARVEFRAKNDPALVGGVSAYDLGFQLTNEFSSGKFATSGTENGVELATNVVGFAATNGYFQDFFFLSRAGVSSGQLGQGGVLSTKVWHTYVLETKNGTVSLYLDGALRYSSAYAGKLGPLDTLRMVGKYNFQWDPSSVKVL